MVAQHYRWDFIGLSSQEKPTPQTSEKVVDGSTFYEADTSKLYVFCKTEWYEKESSGGGGSSVNVVQTTGTSTTDVMSQNAVTEALASGGGPTVVQTTGTSTTDVMSQNATTSMVFANPGTNNKVRIGNTNDSGNYSVNIGSAAAAAGASAVGIGYYASAKGQYSVAIGSNAQTLAQDGVAIGENAKIKSGHTYSLALGTASATTRAGEVNVGTGSMNYGYNSTPYRVIGGVHDGVDANDAVTVGQINALIDAINSATNSNISHIGS